MKNKKIIQFFLFILLIPFLGNSLKAEETEKSKWYIFFAGGTGEIQRAGSSYHAQSTLTNHAILSINTDSTIFKSLAVLSTDYKTIYRTETTPIRIGAEYRMNPSIGFAFDYTNTTFKIKASNHPADKFIPFYELQQLSSYSSNSFYSILLGLSVLSNKSYSSDIAKLQTDTIGLGINYHVLGNGLIDPYLGIGVGYGLCSGNTKCNVTKGSTKIGIQLNFSSFFTFFEGEIEFLDFKFRGESYNKLITAPNKIALLGIGMKF
ncbi:MAG: hypothetical protein H7A23_24590 [Leptospiraceae bacterium]|nr:hypothetical protein [Leptospiraceae bacterium]MCP5497744.1 hypothetical protein [Leptospiraceae bacterium]